MTPKLSYLTYFSKQIRLNFCGTYVATLRGVIQGGVVLKRQKTPKQCGICCCQKKTKEKYPISHRMGVSLLKMLMKVREKLI